MAAGSVISNNFQWLMKSTFPTEIASRWMPRDIIGEQSTLVVGGHVVPTDTWRNNDVIMTSKRRFDVIMALLLRRLSAGVESQCIIHVTRSPVGPTLHHHRHTITVTNVVQQEAKHNNDVIISATASQITGVSIVYSGADQRKFKGPRHWPLWGEFTDDRWIPRTKGQ